MTAEQTAAYITSCAEKRGQTSYFSSRGISEQTAARFSLGYDGALSCVVLPCSPAASPCSSSRAYSTRSLPKNSASVPAR